MPLRSLKMPMKRRRHESAERSIVFISAMPPAAAAPSERRGHAKLGADARLDAATARVSPRSATRLLPRSSQRRSRGGEGSALLRHRKAAQSRRWDFHATIVVALVIRPAGRRHDRLGLFHDRRRTFLAHRARWCSPRGACAVASFAGNNLVALLGSLAVAGIRRASAPILRCPRRS